MPKKLETETDKFNDALNREEIRGVLDLLSRHVNKLSGNDLLLLKRYLKKITDY